MNHHMIIWLIILHNNDQSYWWLIILHVHHRSPPISCSARGAHSRESKPPNSRPINQLIARWWSPQLQPGCCLLQQLVDQWSTPHVQKWYIIMVRTRSVSTAILINTKLVLFQRKHESQAQAWPNLCHWKSALSSPNPGMSVEPLLILALVHGFVGNLSVVA